MTGLFFFLEQNKYLKAHPRSDLKYGVKITLPRVCLRASADLLGHVNTLLERNQFGDQLGDLVLIIIIIIIILIIAWGPAWSPGSSS